MPIRTSTLGYPRIGPRRELKTALEKHWSGGLDEAGLLDTARTLRAAAWREQVRRGIDVVPSNDFSLYDHVLDAAATLGVVPGGLAGYFAAARGSTHAHAGEMTKWFDTNYHFLVPDLAADQGFSRASDKPLDEFREAQALGIDTRPVLLGPVTFLRLAKLRNGGDALALLPRLLPVYAALLRDLHAAGATDVQVDEPVLVLNRDDANADALRESSAALVAAAPGLRVLLATYFGELGDNLDLALSLPVHGLHVDLVRAPGQLDAIVERARPDLALSLGVIDGRNVWRADLSRLLDRIEPVAAARPDLLLAPSCSLLHVPLDLARETTLDPVVAQWLAFAGEKMDELRTLADALNGGRDRVRDALAASDRAAAARRTSPRIHDATVQARLAGLDPSARRRAGDVAHRRAVQNDKLALPPFPTTTIGSFPQTPAVRRARADHDAGRLGDAEYEAFLADETARAIAWQERAGLDVLVHGEFERNDMVQFFAEQLAGFVVTRHAWVQSYGSRCVRPPIIFGDVSRPEPMTVARWQAAQALTPRPVKGMLTGPVTILNWSFVRDDQPRETTCRQLALAIRDEVADLEWAGAAIIQIDEAALREGLPLRRGEWGAYLDWAVDCFRVSSAPVADATQIHTHMCYSEFNDIIEAIAAMDADVISIETARSRMELLDAFARFDYPADIGPGVYDIHAPRVPDTAEMVALLRAAATRLAPERLWVNPDCGLKTRGWAEVEPAIANMVAAARVLRAPAPAVG